MLPVWLRARTELVPLIENSELASLVINFRLGEHEKF